MGGRSPEEAREQSVFAGCDLAAMTGQLGVAERRGRIKTEIWTAYHSAQLEAGSGGRRLVYSIKWDGLKNETS